MSSICPDVLRVCDKCGMLSSLSEKGSRLLVAGPAIIRLSSLQSSKRPASPKEPADPARARRRWRKADQCHLINPKVLSAWDFWPVFAPARAKRLRYNE